MLRRRCSQPAFPSKKQQGVEVEKLGACILGMVSFLIDKKRFS